MARRGTKNRDRGGDGFGAAGEKLSQAFRFSEAFFFTRAKRGGMMAERKDGDERSAAGRGIDTRFPLPYALLQEES